MLLEFPLSEVREMSLRDEVVEIERVVMEHDSANISNNLKDKTANHTYHESPGLVSDAKPELCKEKQAKYSRVESITSQVWNIFYLSTAKRACRYSTIGGTLERTRFPHLELKLLEDR